MTLQLTALRHSAFYTPYLITMAGGYLAEQGIEFEYKPLSPGESLFTALQTSRYHVSQAAVAVSLLALEKGEEPSCRHFAAINQRDGFFLVARQTEKPFEWSDLTGKQVLVDHLFQPKAMFQYCLGQQKLDPKQLTVIDAGEPESMITSFLSGVGDYIQLQGPAAQQLEADGFGTIVATLDESIGPVAFSSLVATQQWLNSELYPAFMCAYQHSCKASMSSSPEQLAKQLQQYGFFTEVTTNVLSTTIERYQQLGCWTSDGEISTESYRKLLQVFRYSGTISSDYTAERVII